MNSQLRERVLSDLHMSNEKALDEMIYLMAYNKLSEFSTELEYYEVKYHGTYEEFDKKFQGKKGSFELENDWMAWKFAVESKRYWEKIVEEMDNDTSNN